MDDDAQKIRRRRLEKLDRPPTAESKSESEPQRSSNELAGGDIRTKQSGINENDRSIDGESIRFTPISDSSASSTPGPAVKSNQPQQSFEEWQDSTLKSLLLVSLDAKDADKYTILASLTDEIEGTLLSGDMLDQLLWTRLTEHEFSTSAFDYLFEVWKKADLFIRKRSHNSPEKTALLSEVQSRVANYAVIGCTSELIDSDQATANLGERLLQLTLGAGPQLYEFVAAMVTSADEQDILLSLLDPVFIYLRDSLAHESYKGDYKKHFAVLEHLLSISKVVAVINQVESFNISDTMTPASIVSETLLGPFLAISPLDQDAAVLNFSNADVISPMEARRISGDVNAELSVIQQRLFNMCNLIVRGSSESRHALLEYFGKIINMNHKRTAIQIDRSTVSSDGFMLNITHILVKLSAPFTDFYGTKIDKIDLHYFQTGHELYDISDETKLAVDNATSKEFYQNHRLNNDKKPNFITHVYFLTMAYLQYGLCASIQSIERLKPAIDHLRMYLARFQAEAAQGSLMARSAVAKFKRQLIQVEASKLALEAVFRSDAYLVPYVDFAIFHSMVIVRAAENPSDIGYPYRGKYSQLKLPLPESPPDYFANYPEYFIEAPLSFLIEVSRFVPVVMLKSSNTPIVVFAVTFLRCSGYIKNPYLKSKIVELLFFGSIELASGRNGYFVNIFDTEKVCLDHLFHSLMKFYIEVEQTGRSSQFYDKFNTRYYISQIIRVIWANNVYRMNLEKESKHDVNFFVQFVALLLNDSTYLLDECLSKLAEIHNLQKELPPGPIDPTEDQQTQEKRNRLRDAEKHASSYMQLTNQTVLLLKLFTYAVPKAFVTPEIVDRLAAMLNYNLAALVGPKCRELKVQNPEKYGFNPRELLSQLTEVYVNLDKEDSFVHAVARDGRSFNISNFNRVKDILSRWGWKSADAVKQFGEFAINAEKARLEDEEGEQELGEIPEEYLDPVMFTLMEEPVTLPSSKVNIDMSTIKQHLLSDPKDPFNREPLTIEQLIPNVELKNEIQEWIRKRRQEAAASKMKMEVDGN